MHPAAAYTFDRPYRTLLWRAFNAVGGLLRRCGRRCPLSVDRVVARARWQTGLDDWGEEQGHEPLRRLLESFEETARLTPLGRTLIRATCVQMVKARLSVRQAIQAHPEVLAERVVRPVFVLGLPRTGTTLLHKLLCQDAGGRPLLLWETLWPAAAPDLSPRRRARLLRLARLYVNLYTRRLMPQVRSIHPMEAEGPEECTLLLLNSFQSPAWAVYGSLPRYLGWLRGLGAAERRRAYEEYRLQLQLMQWGSPVRHWVLKSPFHGFALDTLLDLFPDACVVQTHRDPPQVVASACSLYAVLRGVNTDVLDCRRLGGEVVEHLKQDILEPLRRARSAHPGRVFDVQYQDLVRDPVAVVNRIYDHAGRKVDPGMEERMRRWLAENPPNKHGTHRYDLGQFGLSRAAVEALFADQAGV